MQEQIPASLSLFLGGEIGILVLCTCAIVYGTEPCHRQAGASLTYASIPAVLPLGGAVFGANELIEKGTRLSAFFVCRGARFASHTD